MFKIRDKESLECGRMYINLNIKNPKAVHGPWLQIACFDYATPICYVSNFWPKSLDSPRLTKSWIRAWVSIQHTFQTWSFYALWTFYKGYSVVQNLGASLDFYRYVSTRILGYGVSMQNSFQTRSF